jgi:hypothetical protein
MTLQSLVRSHFEICLEPLKTDQVFPPPPLLQFSILTEKVEEGVLDGLQLEFGIVALRRRW